MASPPSKPSQRRLLPYESSAAPEHEVLEGVIEQVYFINEENGWTAARIKVPGPIGSARVAGTMFGVGPGDHVRLHGRWSTDAKWGKQFQVEMSETAVPTTGEGIQAFLASGGIKGVGPALAARIVERFGNRTLDVITEEPERLTEVDGIGPKRAEQIHGRLAGKQVLARMMSFLQGHGISPSHAAKIHKRYGAAAVKLVEENPYRLADEVFGIGFLTADRIAARMGVEMRSPFRLRAGLVYALDRAADEGHIFLPEAELVARAAKLLGIEEAPIEAILAEVIGDGDLRVDETVVEADPVRAIHRPELFGDERELAKRLQSLVRAKPGAARVAVGDWAAALGWLEKKLGVALAEAQVEAVKRAVPAKVLVITGGPGTGKTTIIRAILELFARDGRRVALAAPTGRAAKRMEEATTRPAKTSHRLLEYDPRLRTFQRDAGFPIDADLVVIDEFSMVDVPLACALLRAVPREAVLILVGDADQLPSVGPGRVLQEVIDSRVAPVVRLTEVFRQAASSRIIVCAHQINRGEMIEPQARGEGRPDAAGELFAVWTEDAEHARNVILRLLKERIPQRYGFDPVDDVQVITPMKRGIVGTEQLNRTLQAELNPGGRALAATEGALRQGDKLMQMRNNYDKDVYNGDIGRVSRVDPDKGLLTVTFDRRRLEYDRKAQNELRLAYACTVHKSQGSEYPAVVMPLLYEHYMLLQRNLLYTAVTRARRLFVLVGSQRALRQAIRNDQIRRRHTMLAELLLR